MQTLVVINLVAHRSRGPFVCPDYKLILFNALVSLNVGFFQAKKDWRCVVLVKLLNNCHLSSQQVALLVRYKILGDLDDGIVVLKALRQVSDR